MERLFSKLIPVLFLFNSFSLSAKTIIVKVSDSDSPITHAIEKALDGDTLLIQAGTYKEGAVIHLQKRLTLIGEGYPVIDGEDKGDVFISEHDGVVFKGIVFSNSGTSGFSDIAGLRIKDSQNVLVEDCKFENNFFAIHTINSRYVTFLNNELVSGQIKGKSSANGIHCWKSTYLTIKGNTITGHRDGIYLEFARHSKIEDNKSINNSRYGLHFMFSHDNIYNHNEFRSNGSGVAVMYSKRVEMYDNLFADNWGNASYGLLLKEIDDSIIMRNEFSNNTSAIFADGANRIAIDKNRFSNNGWAMKINASCSAMEISKNNFIANTFDIATNGNLVMKSMDGNFWDKYEGYDLNRDGIGDIPYRPITFYSIIIERNPGALMLFRSFFVKLMDKAESVFPSLTPEHLKDSQPLLKMNKEAGIS